MQFDIFQHDKSNATECDVQIRMIPMRDGIRLYTRIYLPANGGRKATVFSRSPYNSADNFASTPRLVFIKNNLVDIHQDCRGTGQSDGEADPFGIKEKEDAEDTIKWIVSQEWSNGRIGMEGASYGGFAQWVAALNSQPELVAFTPYCIGCNAYDDTYIGGALFFQLRMHWSFSQYFKNHVKQNPMPNWDEIDLSKHRPLNHMDKAAGLGEVPYWQYILDHSVYSNEWDYGNALKQPEKVLAPAYIKGGWFDFFIKGTIDGFQLLREQGKTEEVRNFTRIVIGPWVHCGNRNPELFDEKGWGYDHCGEIGERFLMGLLADSHKDPVPEEPPVRYFMMGKNEWRSADTWPPVGVVETAYYLHSEFPANTSHGGGVLNKSKPDTDEPADQYAYDPANPVLSRGGCFLGPKECGDGCVTQMVIEGRHDVLCYTSDPLEEDIEIAGNVKMFLWAACSCKDTDFTGKLVDIYPDGTSYNVVDGIQRARFRDGCDREVFLTPNKVEKYVIDLWHTAYAFRKGHRLRVHISSSNFPHFDPNMNTGNKLGEDAVGIIARQLVCHDREHPSHIMLPVLKY